MRYFKQLYLLGIITALSCLPLKAEVTVKDLFFDESKPFHLKIIDVIPEEGILQIGNDDAKNTIIEFMDYFCGYCKKVHVELLQIANERKDTRIIFCGDANQTDLVKTNERNGIHNFMNILRLMNEFGMVEFGVEDIVRSGLIRSYLLNKIALGL